MSREDHGYLTGSQLRLLRTCGSKPLILISATNNENRALKRMEERGLVHDVDHNTLRRIFLVMLENTPTEAA